MLFPRFKKFVSVHRLVAEGDGVVVAASGGLDSMALLDLVCRIARPMRLAVSAAHVNYGLRGRSSDADEALVLEVCRERGIECDSLRRRPQAGANLQDAARRIRYDFFRRSAEKRGARAIATAHHAGDQAETILLHLLRGAGIRGLAGMRPLAERGGMALIRPLLFATRKEIAAYASRRGIGYREDESNASKRYSRNSLRHGILPLFARLNPRAVENIAAAGARLALDDEALDAVASEALDQALEASSLEGITFDRHLYADLPAALRSRVLGLAFARVSGGSEDLKADHIERMDGIALGGRQSATYRLPAGWKFRREGEGLSIAKSGTKCDR